jgi:hypothetical protein
MKILAFFFFTMVIAVCAVAANPSSTNKMRPYVGIGVLLLPIATSEPDDPLLLYEEPALLRLGELHRKKMPALDWIFGANTAERLLIVMSHKAAWLRVSYDDAGREAWLNPSRKMTFQTWDLFYKGHISRMLPGLQKKYYQVFQQPDSLPVATLTANQPFKVLQLENDWAMVLVGQDLLGWLRWRDEDSRLLIGIMTETKVR